jgi:hypothetical protein
MPVGRASQCHMYAEGDRRDAGSKLVYDSRLHAWPWVWHRNVAQPCECSTCAASPLDTCRFDGRHASANRSSAAGYKQVRTSRLRAPPGLPLTRMPVSTQGLSVPRCAYHRLDSIVIGCAPTRCRRQPQLKSCSMYVPCLIAQACPGCSLLWLSCGHIMDSSGLTDHATMPLTN